MYIWGHEFPKMLSMRTAEGQKDGGNNSRNNDSTQYCVHPVRQRRLGGFLLLRRKHPDAADRQTRQRIAKNNSPLYTVIGKSGVMRACLAILLSGRQFRKGRSAGRTCSWFGSIDAGREYSGCRATM